MYVQDYKINVSRPDMNVSSKPSNLLMSLLYVGMVVGRRPEKRRPQSPGFFFKKDLGCLYAQYPPALI